MALQNFEMRSTGVGWKAEACRDPRGCEEGLCVQDAGGHHWHPADPLAFAKWRVRARLADIPAHVLVTTTGGRTKAVSESFARRMVVIGAVGVATAAGVLAVCIGRPGRAPLSMLSLPRLPSRGLPTP